MWGRFVGTLLLGWWWWWSLVLFPYSAMAEGGSGPELRGTIAFATVGRVNYAFDVYTVALPAGFDSASSLSRPSANSDEKQLKEFRITDGKSVNYNGHLFSLPKCPSTLLDGLSLKRPQVAHIGTDLLAYVSERDGSPQIYLTVLPHQQANDTGRRVSAKDPTSEARRRRETEEQGGHGGDPILGRRIAGEEQPQAEPIRLDALLRDAGPALFDRPSLTADRVVYVSTKDPIGIARQSWTAVFSTHAKSGQTNRLTPAGVTDYSPAVSPSGEWVMVASQQGRLWDGNTRDLHTDLYACNAVDGANRRLVVKNGGWPSWADDTTVFFHRHAEDGWWSVYKISFSDGLTTQGPVEAERVTPAGVHAFTPAASTTGKWIAVATRRPESPHRHVEIFDLRTKEFVKLTETLNPNADHFNPFVSPDSGTIGYHRCRGHQADAHSPPNLKPHVEHIKSTVSKDLSVIRIDGAFPSFSPDGSLIVYIEGVRIPGAFVMNLDGSGSRRVFSGDIFGTVWDKKRKGTVYGAVGPTFASEDSTVHIVKIDNADVGNMDVDEGSLSWKVLTKKGSANNAFPNPSPDGKYLVFRSGRSGFKNLYIMDAVHGEEKYLRQLTEGEWDDTMPSWSPDNQWIAFASDRHNPGGGSFALYFIHPNGTGLHKVLNSTLEGRINHPNFSPDSKSIVFTSDLAGQSADPISVPNQFQPYGEIFIAQIDGTGVQRLTHNGYEDGTPSWGRMSIASSDLTEAGNEVNCSFIDAAWLSSVSRLGGSGMCAVA